VHRLWAAAAAGDTVGDDEAFIFHVGFRSASVFLSFDRFNPLNGCCSSSLATVQTTTVIIILYTPQDNAGTAVVAKSHGKAPPPPRKKANRIRTERVARSAGRIILQEPTDKSNIPTHTTAAAAAAVVAHRFYAN